MVVVDCIEGICAQTETVLRQAHCERIMPVLALNKIDRCLLDCQLDGEEVYQKFSLIIENANAIMSKYEDKFLGRVQFRPEKGNVVFSAGLHGWAFTLAQFAKIYASKFEFDESQMMEKLWGENFFDPDTNEWTAEKTRSATCKRGFVTFCYDRIKEIIQSCIQNQHNVVLKLLQCFKANIKVDDKLKGKALMKSVMQAWLPASIALVEAIIFHLPSPSTAQEYRVENLYEGSLVDSYASAIKNCESKGPLILYVSKMIEASCKGRFLAFGRIFSGRVTAGMKVRIMGPNYVPWQKNDLYIQNVQHVISMGKKHEFLEDVPCGNIVILAGLDSFITKNATLTNEQEIDAWPIRAMKFSVSPVVLVAVQCKVASSFPKLVEGLKCLVKYDPLVLCKIEETGEHFIAGAGELHLEVCLKYLQCFMDGAEITISTPGVTFRETILKKSCQAIMTESQNKHNRLSMMAEPLSEELINAIDGGHIRPTWGPLESSELIHKFKGDFGPGYHDLASGFWCFGPDTNGPNMVVNTCKGKPYINEIRDSVVAGFQWASKEGALAEENMRGICFKLCDSVLHVDAINRASDQVIPMVMKSVYASQLASKPRLLEPVYLVEIQAPEHARAIIYGVLNTIRGKVLQEIQMPGTPLYNIRAHVPVSESFGFSNTLRTVTSDQAFLQCVFDHWDVVPSDPLEADSPAAQLVLSIRRRKGLKLQVPTFLNM